MNEWLAAAIWDVVIPGPTARFCPAIRICTWKFAWIQQDETTRRRGPAGLFNFKMSDSGDAANDLDCTYWSKKENMESAELLD
jgi:hypothetical protein